MRVKWEALLVTSGMAWARAAAAIQRSLVPMSRLAFLKKRVVTA